jgi:cation transport ATPase
MKNGIGVAAFIGAHSRHPLAPAIAAEDTFRTKQDSASGPDSDLGPCLS